MGVLCGRELTEEEKIEIKKENAKDPLCKQNLDEVVEAIFARFDVERKGYLTRDQGQKFLDEWLQENSIHEKEYAAEIKFEHLTSSKSQVSKDEILGFLYDYRYLSEECKIRRSR